MMSKRLACLLALASAAVAIPAPSWRLEDEPPAGFEISSIAFSGVGCPEGSTYSFQNADDSAISVAFSNLFAETSSSSKVSCRVALALTVPAGYAVGVKKVAYSTFYDLESGVAGSRSSAYSFEGKTEQATSQSDYTGPVPNTQFSTTDLYDSYSTIKSACGENTVLNIDIEVEADNSGASSALGYAVVDTIDAHLQFGSCDPSA